MSTPQSIVVKPSGKALGADIEGIDVSKPLDDALFQSLHQ
ncbi:MAG TPA: taurine dioxygenase, partial [Rhodospirillaceae bacterium]|nr:taurine dioxygenase [Rhodospirillaceae bacterium]